MMVIASQRPEITVYDPKGSRAQMLSDLNYLGTLSPEKNERYLTVVNDLYQAADKAHAIALLTEKDEFKGYDYARIFDRVFKRAFIFEGRGLLNKTTIKEQGFKVYTIGE
mgnify:CR=1 FL=1